MNTVGVYSTLIVYVEHYKEYVEQNVGRINTIGHMEY